jgi:methionine-rich copper-binding protein CopC/putative copper export protein
MSRRRLFGTLLAALTASALVALVAPPAQAHAYLVGSNPADGERLETAPHQLRLQFSEHVVLGATRLQVVDSHGHQVRIGDVRVVSEDSDIEEPSAITATLPDLAPDAYRVRWQTLSSDDLHRTGGVVLFGIGRTVAPVGPTGAPTRWDEALLRAALLVALALAGGSLLGSRVLPDLGGRPARAAAWIAVGSSVALLVDQVLAAGSSPATVLAGSYPARWALRTGGLVLLAVAWSRTPREVRPGRIAWVGLGLAGLGTAMLGHASTLGPVGVVVAAAHVTAALTWSGAVGCLALALAHRQRTLGVAGTRQALRTFAFPAAAGLSIVVLSGLYLSSDTVLSIDAGLLTTYGRALGAKVALVGLAGLLALANHRRVRGPRDLDVPVPGLRAEAVALGVVLLLAGVLASSGTATDPSFRPAPTASASPVSQNTGDLEISAGVRPNRIGTAVALVGVFDTRRPARAPVVGVDVSVAGAARTAAEPLGDGQWTAPVTVSRSGATTVVVTVHRPGLPDRVGRLAWTVGADQPSRATVVSRAPLRRPLLIATGILAGLLAAAWTVVAATGRRRGRSARPTTVEARTVASVRG